MKKCVLLAGLGWIVFGGHKTVDATENTAMESAISITLKERDLTIQSVQLPDFGKQMLNGKAQVFKSKQDLVVRVKDKRMSTAPWTLRCVFKPGASLEPYQEGITYRIGEGTLSTVVMDKKERIIPLARERYETNSVAINDESENSTSLVKLVQGNSEQETMYEYRVKKNQIVLEIPAGMPAGIYEGAQVVLFTDVPE